jgi:hypothetical protein
LIRSAVPVATIQLDTEVLAVERLIDAQDHDEAFRQMILLRDRYGRRPEYRYLQAFFDATFKVRADRELIPQVIALVGEQPDFTEAIALLAVLYHRIDEQEKAEVFAREALRSKNVSARRRAREVLGLPPEDPQVEAEASRRPSRLPPGEASTPSPAGGSPRSREQTPARLPPVVMPPSGSTPSPEDGASLKRPTRDFFPTGTPSPREQAGGRPDSADGWKLPSEPPPAAVPKRSTLDALRLPPAPPGGPAQPGVPAAPAPEPDPLAAAVVTREAPRDLPPPTQDSQPASTFRHASSEPPDLSGAEADIMDRFRMPLASDAAVRDDRFDHATQPALRPMGEPAPAVETIEFSPRDAPMPPPPTIPPEALAAEQKRSQPMGNEAPTARAIRKVDQGDGRQVDDDIRHLSDRPVRVPSEPPTRRLPSAPSPAQGMRRTDSDGRLGELSGEGVVDRTGIDRTQRVQGSRPAMAIPPSIEVQRQWFRYARTHQIVRPGGEGEPFSTAATLLDLAERVVEGATPLSEEPIPLDRRGLIQVEQRLEAFRRGAKSSQAATERAGVTAAAAFLMALLLKECDGRAADTSAEDGACKVTLPAGATVRPLLVAAAYARSRGPGLVETFDRAATAHMRRSPTRPNRPSEPVRRGTQPPPRDTDLTVLRRDLDAGTLALIAPNAPHAPPPRTPMRAVAAEFWASPTGREIASSSRRVGTFTLADIDALERYAGKVQGPVGYAPPGTPWPWMPSEELEDAIFAWGAVLGEVLSTLYTGRWEADPGNPDDRMLVRVVLTGGVVAWPVAKVYLRFARGITHDLSSYVDVVGRVVGRQTLNSASWP